MIVVIDKQVVKHLVETGDGLLEIPVRVSFEYHSEDSTFIDGSMSREYLYNRPAVRKHVPQLDDHALDRAQPALEESDVPQLILPGDESWTD